MKSLIAWREKLERVKEHKIVDIPQKWQKRYGEGKMLIPKPLDVDALIRKVRAGKLITVKQIREHLAKRFKVNTTCPLTTGIFIRIAAETAEEDRKKGRKRITPYWRVLKSDGSLNEKYPGGISGQKAKLEKEGQTIFRARGKRLRRLRISKRN